MSVRIVGLGGSLRTSSSSLLALQLTLRAASAVGANVELLDVRALRLPWYGADGVEAPSSATRLAEMAADADGMIWSSPMYHGTVSGAFKNALDWLQLLADRDPPFLTDKPVGLIATAAGAQGMQAINTMELAVRALRGWAVPFVVPISRAGQAFHADGTARDLALAAQLVKLGREVVAAAHRFAA